MDVEPHRMSRAICCSSSSCADAISMGRLGIRALIVCLRTSGSARNANFVWAYILPPSARMLIHLILKFRIF